MSPKSLTQFHQEGTKILWVQASCLHTDTDTHRPGSRGGPTRGGPPKNSMQIIPFIHIRWKHFIDMCLQPSWLSLEQFRVLGGLEAKLHKKWLQHVLPIVLKSIHSKDMCLRACWISLWKIRALSGLQVELGQTKFKHGWNMVSKSTHSTDIVPLMMLTHAWKLLGLSCFVSTCRQTMVKIWSILGPKSWHSICICLRPQCLNFSALAELEVKLGLT